VTGLKENKTKVRIITQKFPPQRRSNGGTKAVLRFGDLVAEVYERCGKARGNGLLRLAINARLIAFPGQRQFMIVTQ
jgi:hypothetical protein